MTDDPGIARFEDKLAEIERAAAEDVRGAARPADKDRALEEMVARWNRRLLAARLFDRSS